MASYYNSLLLLILVFNIAFQSFAYDDSYDSPATEENDLNVETKVKRIVCGWRKLSDEERNRFKTLLEVKGKIKNSEQQQEENYIEDDYEDETTYDGVETQGKTSLNRDLEIYSYFSQIFYYPTIEWNLDKSPDNERYWVGLFKVGSSNKQYLSYKWIGNVAQGVDKTVKLNKKYKSTSKSNTRHDKFELRIFKGDRRLEATSNILNGVIHAPPFKMHSSTKQIQENHDKKLNDFLSAIQSITDYTKENLLLFTNYDYSVKDLIAMWQEFSKKEQHILFTILEQDCPSPHDDEIIEAQNKEIEPLGLYPNLSDDETTMTLQAEDRSNEPSEISLNIAIRRTCTFMYPAIKTKGTDLSGLAWMGIYKAKKSKSYSKYKGRLKWNWVGAGHLYTKRFLSIKECKNGPINTQYLGVIFDYKVWKGYKQVGFANSFIEVVISTTPAAPPPIFKPGFNTGHALTMAYMSQTAYKNYKSTVKDRIKKYHLEAKHQIYDKKTDTNGFIASNSSTIIIAFKGSDTIKNWWTNFQIGKETISSSRKTIRAHAGFIKALNKVYSDIVDVIKNDIGRSKTKKTLFITGHSLGGALASLLTFRLILEHNIHPILYTYACPPTGDINFARFFEGLESYTITNDGDFVSDGLLVLFSTIGPWDEFYKPMQEYYLHRSSGKGFIEGHKISGYIDVLKKLKK